MGTCWHFLVRLLVTFVYSNAISDAIKSIRLTHFAQRTRLEDASSGECPPFEMWYNVNVSMVPLLTDRMQKKLSKLIISGGTRRFEYRTRDLRTGPLLGELINRHANEFEDA